MTIVRVVTLTLLAALAFAIASFPTDDSTETLSPENRYESAVRRAAERYTLQLELLRRATLREEARDAVAHASPDAPLLVVRVAPELPAALELRLRAGVASTFASLPRRDSSVRVFVLVDNDTSAFTRRAGRAYHRELSDVFSPGAFTSNSCVIIARTAGADITSWPGLVGPCWWYAAYGLPGRGVSAWLDSTHRAAINTPGSSFHALRERRSELPAFVWPLRDADDPQGMIPFPDVTECAVRRAGACERLLLGAQHTPAIAFANWNRAGEYAYPFNFYAAYFLQTLELELGPPAFATLWKSDASMPDAFAAARGESLEHWIFPHVRGQSAEDAQVRGWVRRESFALDNQAFSRGPVPSPLTLLALLVAIPALCAAGAWKGASSGAERSE